MSQTRAAVTLIPRAAAESQPKVKASRAGAKNRMAGQPDQDDHDGDGHAIPPSARECAEQPVGEAAGGVRVPADHEDDRGDGGEELGHEHAGEHDAGRAGDAPPAE
jgi:hypothetical protein